MEMEISPVIKMIGIECGPKAAQRFNKWVEEVHIPMLLKFEGIRRITRYQISKAHKAHSDNSLVFPTEEYPNYLTIIEFENQQALEAYEARFARSEALKDAQEKHAELGFERKWRVNYKPLRTWSK